MADAPYRSARDEALFFFGNGIPLGLSAILEWGVPPLFTQIMAGRTSNSSQLQSALGFGRVYYNITIIMVIMGLLGYCSTVIPGCVGAGRPDRVAMYFKRSLAICALSLLPMLGLQLVAGPVVEAIGVDSEIASQVGDYCRLMIVPACLLLIELHLQTVFVSLGFAKSAVMNSVISCVVDMGCAYLFIYKLELGVRGAVYTQIVVKSCRIATWLVLGLSFKLADQLKPICGEQAEKLFDVSEVRLFAHQALPKILFFFAGWIVFELQLVLLANISQIPHEAVTAGAVWVQMESTLGAVQTGWVDSTSIRTLTLLGKQDQGAYKAFAVLCSLSSFVVLLTNAPIVILSEGISTAFSNNELVSSWLQKLLWVLALQAQTRVAMLTLSSLMIPVGKGTLNALTTFAATYLVACPIAGSLVLTDWGTCSISAKMQWCMATSSISNGLVAIVGLAYTMRMDWDEAAIMIAARAHSDKRATSSKTHSKSALDQQVKQEDNAISLLSHTVP